MAIWLKQSTASQEIPLGYFVDSTDGNTEETALTIANTDIKIWKTGATTLANKNSGGATHISNGVYYAVLDATDTDTLGPLVVFVHVAGALSVRVECLVLPANVYDSLVAGTDTLQADVTQWLGTAAATPTVAGVPEVDITHVGGSAVSTSSAQIGVNVVNAGGTAWGSGAITAASIAADAITAAKIADGAIDAATFAAGAINAAAIAADAIGASELAADAVAEIADAVWDEAIAGHAGAGSTGEALSNASSAGDPWSTALPGAYGAGTAGKIVGDNLNATVSSRASQTSLDTVDDFLDTEVAAILAAVDTETAAILALLDDARGEPSQGAPPVNPDLATKIDWLYASWRNKKDNNGTTTNLYADDGTTVIAKQTTSESGGTVTKAEWITGA